MNENNIFAETDVTSVVIDHKTKCKACLSTLFDDMGRGLIIKSSQLRNTVSSSLG